MLKNWILSGHIYFNSFQTGHPVSGMGMKVFFKPESMTSGDTPDPIHCIDPGV
jgi:hypothetical protein